MVIAMTFGAAMILVAAGCWCVRIRMPGRSGSDARVPLTESEVLCRVYYTPEDPPDKVDYDSMARVSAGLEAVVEDLASAPIH